MTNKSLIIPMTEGLDLYCFNCLICLCRGGSE